MYKSRNHQTLPLALVGVGLILLSLVAVWIIAGADEHRLTFPIWPDPQQLSMRAFHAFNLPNSYLIDRSGIVRLAWTGAISEAMLEKYVTPLLRE